MLTLKNVYELPLPKVEPLGASPIVLYGAGSKGRECLRLLRDSGYEVCALVDQRVQEPVDCIPVYQPSNSIVAELAAKGCVAVVSVFNYTIDPLLIKNLLVSIGFRRVVGIAQLRQLMPIGETYWLADRAAMVPPEDISQWLWDRLADEESRETLVNVVALRRLLDPTYLRSLSAFDQYIPASVPTPRFGIRLIDGGAFDGDTLVAMTTAGCHFEAVAAFEPDAANYSRLAAKAAELPLGQEIALYPCGLGEKLSQVRFNSQGLSSSSIDPNGNSLIQIVKLDEAMPRFRPTYIKLDIEGAELAAVRGMAKTIATEQPALAICVYHKPSDLWDIPQLVDHLLPDARFFLRAHAWNGFELVFYAIPS